MDVTKVKRQASITQGGRPKYDLRSPRQTACTPDPSGTAREERADTQSSPFNVLVPMVSGCISQLGWACTPVYSGRTLTLIQWGLRYRELGTCLRVIDMGPIDMGMPRKVCIHPIWGNSVLYSLCLQCNVIVSLPAHPVKKHKVLLGNRRKALPVLGSFPHTTLSGLLPGFCSPWSSWNNPKTVNQNILLCQNCPVSCYLTQNESWNCPEGSAYFLPLITFQIS